MIAKHEGITIANSEARRVFGTHVPLVQKA